MPQKAGADDDESWTQTLVTVTPEDDAAIRTITESTVISAIGDTPLDLRVDQVTDRKIVQANTMRRDLFIDDKELEEIIAHNDAECQTFLRGVPKVELPSAFRDEASQTMYLGKICLPFRDITRIMNDRIMPAEERVTEGTQTVFTFGPEISKNEAVDRLTVGIKAEDFQGFILTEQTEDPSSRVRDKLYFILDRVLWLSDPDYAEREIDKKDEAAQTLIKFDHGLGKVVLDADTQTSLTCDPKRSNTGLLSGWSEMKEFARDIIDRCLESGVHPRSIVHSILDEIIERCAGLIHFPYTDKTVQTLAPCNALKDKDDEVLRKLRLEIVVDTLESSIVVLPLVGLTLEAVCLVVRDNAIIVVAEILNRTLKNSVTMSMRFAAIRQEATSHKPAMEDILNARKKRLEKLLHDKGSAMHSSSAQTELAGFPEMMKIKEPKETVCSTCVRHSDCYVCETGFDDEQEDTTDVKRGEMLRGRILRTQDILIAYNPCYLVTTPSKIPKTQPLVIPRRNLLANEERQPPSRAKKLSLNPCEPETKPPGPDEFRRPCSRSAKLREAGQARTNSLNDWAKVVQEASSTSGPWSIRGSSSAGSNSVDPRQIGGPVICPSRKPPNRENAKFRGDLSARSVQALSILKKTFIERYEESCSDCSYDREKVTGEDPPESECLRVVPVINLSNRTRQN